jgi:hypothetical protein
VFVEEGRALVAVEEKLLLFVWVFEYLVVEWLMVVRVSVLMYSVELSGY